MFKVLIIDDEPIIRKGLKTIINWRNFDCEVCGEASDGSDGCEMIKRFLPDIIITDIKMPEIDGLTMIRDIKDIVPDSKIIILTGYRDFDYAHEAIRLGAFDFLLKPSKLEEITTVISKAVKELRFLKERSEELDKLKVYFSQNLPILREKLLYDVIYEINTNQQEIRERMELFDISIGDFTMLLVQNDAEETEGSEISQYDRHLYHFGIMNTFEEIFSDAFKITGISLNDMGIAFIIAPEGEVSGITEIIDKKCTYLQDIIKNCFGFTATIAVSSEGSGPEELPLKFKECKEALGHKFYLGSNSIIFHSDVDSFFKYEDHSILEKLQKSLLEGIKSGNLALVKEKLLDMFNYAEGLDPAGMDFVRNFYWNTISMANSIRLSLPSADNEKKTGSGKLNGLYGLIEKCGDMKELDTILEEAVMSVTVKVNNYNNKSIKLILRKAIEYIQAHFSEQVTLNEVAEHTYVSTYYISRMFKREMGKNFVDYLNEIRIDKAKELLKDVRYKTYEVAEIVGIPDPHYFSRLFKKYVGVTPTEYRGT